MRRAPIFAGERCSSSPAQSRIQVSGKTADCARSPLHWLLDRACFPTVLSEADQFHIVGASLMVIAAGLFALSKTSGSLKAKLFGQEVELSAPSLAFLLAGVGVFIFPHTSLYVDRTRAEVADNSVEAAATDEARNAVEPMTNQVPSDDGVEGNRADAAPRWRLEPDVETGPGPAKASAEPPVRENAAPESVPANDQSSSSPDEPITMEELIQIVETRNGS